MTTIDEILASNSPLNLDPDFDGGCPCAKLEGDGFSIDIHCWRTSRNCSCRNAGIHVYGIEGEMAKQVADHIMKNSGWPNVDWSVTNNLIK